MGKYKSRKLIQYGSATINIKIDNRESTSSEYNLYNSVIQNITLEIPDLDRGYCNVVCISRTGTYVSMSSDLSTNNIGFWLYSDVVIGTMVL